MTKKTAFALIALWVLAVVTIAVFFMHLVGFGTSHSRSEAEALPEQADEAFASSRPYRSEVKGYSVVFPRNWTEVPSSIEIGSVATDVFYSLETNGNAGVVPTLSITSESLPPGTDLNEYLEMRLAFLDSVQTEVSEPRQVEVGGEAAYIIDYDGYSRENSVEASSVILVKDGEGWEFTFSVPAGERSNYRPLLASVLHSVTIH